MSAPAGSAPPAEQPAVARPEDTSPAPLPAPARRRVRGLRQRLVLAFALGGLALSAVLALVTYELGERYLLRQRERTATRLAFTNARVVLAGLADPAVDPRALLETLDLSAGGGAVLRHRGEWYGTTVGVGRDALPAALRDAVADGAAVRQRVRLVGEPSVVVGTSLPGVDAGYFEAFSLVELERTLDTLRLSALAAAAFGTLAAGVLGIWAGRRVLRPVAAASDAAARIAHGDLTARLDVPDDPDLTPLADSFNEMVDAVRERIEREERFVSDVSHELRSPLTTLSSAAELLEARRGDLGERGRLALDLLVAEVERFRRLVEELLELGRGDAGVATLELEPVRLDELVLHIVTRRPGPGFPVVIDPTVAAEPVLLDKRRIERMLVNLLENAGAHGVAVAGVEVGREGDVVLLAVEDRGPGVPPEERTRVFERFYRGGAAGRRGDGSGAGLGLALVVEHARLHGGRAYVEDAASGGARFVVELPWRPA